jgi:hypothetical protein
MNYNIMSLTLALAQSFIVSLLVTYILLPWVGEGAAAPSTEAETLGVSDERPKSRGAIL